MAVRNKNNAFSTVTYGRVLTAVQDYDRQVPEQKTYADRMGCDIRAEFCEKVIGAKRVNEREQLSQLLAYITNNHIDNELIYECSRSKRRVVDFLTVIEHLTEQGISVYIHQNGLETLQPDGKPNPIAQLVLGILAQFNSMERSLIRSRMESGYNHYRSNGGVVGRKIGYKKPDEVLMVENAEVVKLLKKGYSLRNISKITRRSVNTITNTSIREISNVTNSQDTMILSTND